MSTYTQHDDILKPAPSDLPQRVKSKLPLGTYSVGLTPEGYYLQIQDDFRLPPKIYGDTPNHAKRILDTFQDRTRSTGVSLAGEKGSGKTLLATMLSVEGRARGISTIIVNAPYHGEAFNAFIQSIDEDCVVLFDEFEKVYHEEPWQNALLTLLDGTAVTKKLFVLTTNDAAKVSKYLRNRPGRVFYALEYQTLDDAFVREYCEDCLKNSAHIESVCVVASLYERFNFDMLKALVEEMNRYGEDVRAALRMLNIKPDFKYQTYDCTYLVGDHPHPAAYTDFKTCNNSPSTWDAENDDEVIVDFYNVPRVEYKEDNPEHTKRQVEFNNTHIVSVDTRKGAYILRNEDVQMTVTKRRAAPSFYDVVKLY